jgi:hypothetical protein
VVGRYRNRRAGSQQQWRWQQQQHPGMVAAAAEQTPA